MREAVVAARPDPSGEMSLAAYIVLRDGPDPSIAAELRRWLLGTVPEYMVPSAFVFLDALPLTPNGKVDRQALPDPGRAPACAGCRFVPPRGPIEEALAEIWAELLGGESVGAHDNFFERGGHSLLAIQLLSRLRHTFEVEVPLRDFLEDPTVSRLARIVEQALEDGTAPSAPPSRAGRPRRSVAGFVRAAAALVPRSTRTGSRVVSHPGGRQARGPA